MLIGREREAAELDRLLSASDGPRLVRVLGERGVGRTAFLRAAARRQRAAGRAVLWVDCLPGDGVRPYLLAVRLVRALAERRPEPADRRAGDPVAETLAAVEHG